MRGRRDLVHEGSAAFESPGDPFRTAGRKPKPRVRIEPFNEGTELFKRSVLTPIVEGQIKWRNVPLLGAPGSSKTSRAITIAWMIGEHYGWENVNVVISDDLMALAGAMRPVKVNVLIVDDALRKYQSRGGTTKQMKEAIGKFVELRHELEDVLSGKSADGSGKTEGHIGMEETGIVYCFFTAQMYKGLEKTFRDGVPFFCSPLTEDKPTVMALYMNKCSNASLASSRANAAWGFLEDINFAIEVEGDESKRRWGVAVLPKEGPCKVQIPWYKTICMRCGASDQDRKKGCKRCKAPAAEVGLEPESINPKTGKPYMKRVKAPPEETEAERIARLNTVYEYVANLFLKEHDPGAPDARRLLNVWLRERCAKLGTEEEHDNIMRSTDWLYLIQKSGHILEHAIKQKREIARRQQEQHVRELFDKPEGEPGTIDDDNIIEHVRDAFIRRCMNRGVDPVGPTAKMMLREFIRDRWRGTPQLRDRIQKLREEIYASIVTLVELGEGLPQGGGQSDSGDGVTPLKAAADANRVERVAPIGTQFMFDREKYLPHLIERQVVREVAKGVRRQEAEATWMRRVHAYHLNVYLDKKQPDIQANWRKYFGPDAKRPFSDEPWGKLGVTEKTDPSTGRARDPFTQKTLSNWKLRVQSALGDALGEAYEVWVTDMLNEGWRPSWAKPGVRIKKATRGGGGSHDPDVKVEYEDGDVDWLSLKCYEGREYITLNLKATEDSEHIHVKPELLAFQEHARRKDIHTEHRLVIMARDIQVDGMEVWVAFHDPDDFPEKVAFNRRDVGTEKANTWTRPTTKETAKDSAAVTPPAAEKTRTITPKTPEDERAGASDDDDGDESTPVAQDDVEGDEVEDLDDEDSDDEDDGGEEGGGDDDAHLTLCNECGRSMRDVMDARAHEPGCRIAAALSPASSLPASSLEEAYARSKPVKRGRKRTSK